MDDLRKSFTHLADNGGTWTSESINFHSGKQTFPNYAGSLINVPDAISNFLQAVDSRVDTLSDSVSRYRNHGRSVYEKFERAREIDSRGAWKEVGQGLNGVKTTAQNMQGVLWLAPPVWRVTSSAGRTAARVGPLARRARLR